MKNIEITEKMLKELSPTEFKLYIYILYYNKDRRKYYIPAPLHIASHINISQATYYRAIKKLKDKQYI